MLAASDLKEGALPGADGKFADDARNVIVLTVEKPVKAGSKVS